MNSQSPCVVVEPDEYVIHHHSAVVAGMLTEISQQRKQFTQLFLLQQPQHSLADIECGKLGRFIPIQ